MDNLLSQFFMMRFNLVQQATNIPNKYLPQTSQSSREKAIN